MSETAQFRFHDLPYDIQASIFEEICFPAQRSAFPDCESQTLAAITISHVCRSWHSISLANHILWSAVPFIAYPKDSARTSLKPEYVVPLYLHRSGSVPLDVHLEYIGGRYGYGDDRRNYIGLLSQLLETAVRWRSLAISGCRHPMATQMLLDRFRSGFPSLRSLGVEDWEYAASTSSTMELPVVVADLPHLATLSTKQHITRIVLPWSQIVELTTSREEHALQVLHESSVITSIHLKNLFPPLGYHDFGAFIQAPKSLRHLTICMGGSLLQTLELPSLQSLTLECHPDSHDPLTPFLEQRLFPLLSKAPSLRDLKLSFTWGNWPINPFVRPSGDLFLPNLRKLTVSFNLPPEDYEEPSLAVDVLLDVFWPNHEGSILTSRAISTCVVQLRVWRLYKSLRRPKSVPLIGRLFNFLPSQSSSEVVVDKCPTARILQYDDMLRAHIATQRQLFEERTGGLPDWVLVEVASQP